jgi:hypothetical protein
LASKTINLENPITDTSSYTLVSMDFDQRVVNENSKYLAAKIYSTVQCTFRICDATYSDIPYNPGFYWTTGTTFSPATGSYSPTSTTVKVLYMEFYDKLVMQDYTVIGTDPKDKFHKLFAECLEKSESLGSIFETKIRAKYIIGSQNVTVSGGKYSYPDSNRSFTGVVFPIGVIPSDIISYGCSIPISARSYNGSTSSITSATAYLYSVDIVPEKSTIGSGSFNSLNPTLLRTVSTSTLINNGETAVVNFIWDKPFQNTDESFLMLGYACNSYISRTKISSGSTHASFCKSVDGQSYTNLVSFYNAQTNKVG